MKGYRWIAGFSILLGLLGLGSEGKAETVAWGTLPPLPDDHGLAGPYAGVIGERLFVAGGANFPEAPPWEGGQKVWHDRIFSYSPETERWELLETRLPEARAYGVSVSLPDRESIVMLGGSDQENAPTTSVVEMRWEDGTPVFTELPSLPMPLAESSGVSVGQAIYLFSGRTTEGTARVAFRLETAGGQYTLQRSRFPD